jgi:hypothetical protein
LEVKELAIRLFQNEVSVFTPTGEGLFDHNIKYPHVTEAMRHYWHKVWLFRAKALLKQAETDSGLAERIKIFIEANSKTDWVQVGWDIYKASEKQYPEITSEMVTGIECCEAINAG